MLPLIRSAISSSSSAAGAPERSPVTALGQPARDLATTRFGTVSYAVLRRLPRRLMDRAGERQLRRLARKGHFARSPMAAELDQRLRS